MDLKIFSELDFLPALHTFFDKLKVPIHHIADEPTSANTILKDTYKDNDTFKLINDVYFVGMVDDAAFAYTDNVVEPHKIEKDYDGILIFGVTLHDRPNDLLPTRTQLAEIARAFNREFYYTPVVVVFKYNNYIAFANTERLKYKQEYREGEKAGKVSLLRDVNISKPHAGHQRILAELKIPTSGISKVDSFAKLYAYWQEVLSVNILNKKFYKELSNWFFWAIGNVQFPGAPTFEEAHTKNVELESLQQQHKATNVIRMLTRLLFVWFLKEKKLIPNELFDLNALQQDILNDITPIKQNGLFKEDNVESIYYKAILQNLFFATLNCPIEGDNIDKRKRGFRKGSSNFGTMFLMRYEKYFKDKDAFLELMNSTVPFLNGGLFECLDERGLGEKREERIWIDGFSDNLPKEEHLVVPDYLFFGKDEYADLSEVVGINTKEYKNADVKGLINILESYKFTITENTPIEEDVALDPELLGKVFENLLASYNPETKTTARKQTGSFYTPREIVNYMVDESLIAYLKNAIPDWEGLDNNSDEVLDKKLHLLTSFDSKVPFENNINLQRSIIEALSQCTILDPACGSGAFPMGILQKMVHILQKLDPDNNVWKEVQRNKAKAETEEAFSYEKDKSAREQRLIEINEAFDQNINDPDYARKLFLIENCIFGVDIQPIATQISKLRFFISLVVEQKVNPDKENFGIRPLPNLETKFVAANTLIGINKSNLGIFTTEKQKELEAELKVVRSKLFTLKSKERKVFYRKKDKELRDAIATELQQNGWETDTAQKLASWDPYDQNATSPFFDPEWMFDIKEGFDVVIGNPPYIQLQKDSGTLAKQYKNKGFETFAHTGDIYSLFYEKGWQILKNKGALCYITSNKWMRAGYGKKTRKFFTEKTNPIMLIDFAGQKIFQSATVDTNILLFSKDKNRQETKAVVVKENALNYLSDYFRQNATKTEFVSTESWVVLSPIERQIKEKIERIGTPLKDWDIRINYGIKTGFNEAFIIDGAKRKELIEKDPKSEEIIRPLLRGRDIKRYSYEFADLYLITTFPSLKIDIKAYPAVKEHLLSFGYERLKQTGEKGSRKRTNNQWFETQDTIGYWEDFYKQKIIYNDIAQNLTFGFAESGLFFNNTVYFINGEERILKYLIGFLNSSLIEWYYKTLSVQLGEKAVRLFTIYVERLPIIRYHQENDIVELVKLILADSVNTAEYSSKINNKIFELYNLSIEEIEFIESQ